MRQYRVKEDQNIFDIAVQEYGGVEGIINLIEDNPEIESVDHIFKNGDEIFINDEQPVEVSIKKIFATRSLEVFGAEEPAPAGDFSDDFNDDF